MRILTHDDVHAALTPAEAVDALRQALRDGYDPATDQPRTKVPLHRGEMQLLPSTLPRVSGVKILAVQPEDHDPALPLIQGQYLLIDGTTLTPLSLLDGTALTTLRTPAVSLAGVTDFLPGAVSPLKVVIIGTGAQGRGHAVAVESVVGAEGASISFVSRTEADLGHPWLRAGSAEAAAALKAADLVVCATTATSLILARDDVRPDAIIIAVGSHTTDARELASDLMGAAHVIVEDVDAALREAGDVTLAIGEGALAASDLIPMKDVVTGAVELGRDRPIVFKTVGMPWEDLVVADAVYRA
ncbi:ornithine cyclodeaminase family protein [Corynebacterium timonense]|uniref:Ornithine cyclodeaminase n=1 Tax=Corynebacterium timonense TaxID=441500 RepID=A0A1H1M974_9CORY|nr:ornithine cyclodeaminase family protein [Corynebacterium timonense]SDR82945.1 ornithine cyclodeaminase [Corynebacterium timonense]